MNLYYKILAYNPNPWTKYSHSSYYHDDQTGFTPEKLASINIYKTHIKAELRAHILDPCTLAYLFILPKCLIP